MEQKISGRSALKRMGAAAAGMALFGEVPGLAKVLQGSPASEASALEQQVDESKILTIKMPDYPLVYEGPDVVIHQINDHLWIGNGHQMYNESIYIVEGSSKALLIDTGTRIDNLDKIVAGITKKPVSCLLTHLHGDHAGSVKWFDEIWITKADGVNPPRNYQGKINYIENHQIFDLGDRKIEALYTPGHTPDSVTFLDPQNHIALSGDAFGSTNLLMNGTISTFINTAKEMLDVMNRQQIYYMLPGHFDGENAETSKRVFDLLTIAQGVLDGKIVGEKVSGGLNRRVTWQGVRFNYNESLVK